MRPIFVLFFSFTSLCCFCQTYKQVLAEAYHCDNDSCFEVKLKNAHSYLTSDTARAFEKYIRFFYYVKKEKYDSADYYYPIAQAFDRKIKNWPIYFNTLDARINTLQSRNLSDKAIFELKEGIDLAQSKGLTLEKAKLHTRLSYLNHGIGLYSEGILQGITAKKLLETTTLYLPELMNAINVVAINFDDWGKSDSALFYHYLNLEIGLDKTTTAAKASTYNNIGNTYLKIDKLDSAQRYLEKSLLVARETRNYNNLATVLNNLGDIYLRTGEIKASKEALDSALYFSEMVTSAQLEKRRDVYNTLYRYYQTIGDMSNAFKYQSLFIQCRDSMQDLEQIEKIRKLELQAATSEKDKEIANTELKVKNRNIWIMGISALVLLLAGFARQLHLKKQKTAQEAQLKLQEEKLRISRDLHDNIGAELSYITSIIDQKTFSLEDKEAKKELEQLSNSSRNAMAQLRETIWAIKTDEITVEDFTRKLSEISQKYSDSLGIAIQVSNTCFNPILKTAHVINLFRVCQEAINNAMKYSGCSAIRIDLKAENNLLKISIVDDGKGFDVLTTKTGYGLQNMKERIEEIGGTYNLKSISSEGTSISVSLPLRNSSY
jgi:signal transduction histidine kinase